MEEKSQAEEGGADGTTPTDSDQLGQLEKFELEFCHHLCPVLIKVAQRLVQYAHLFVCSPFPLGEESAGSPAPLGVPQQALDVLLYLSGQSLVSPKDKPPFNSHLPEQVNERLKMWESALVIDPVQKKKLSIYDDVQVAVCMVNFLDLHFLAFGGMKTYSPTRGLKSAIVSVLMILDYMANIFHEHREDPATSQMLWSLTAGLVPMSCDIMMEFTHAQLLKFVLSDREYSHSCTKGRVTRCLDVLRSEEVRECELLGTILANLFRLLVAMLKDVGSEEESMFDFFFCSDNQPTCKWQGEG